MVPRTGSVFDLKVYLQCDEGFICVSMSSRVLVEGISISTCCWWEPQTLVCVLHMKDFCILWEFYKNSWYFIQFFFLLWSQWRRSDLIKNWVTSNAHRSQSVPWRQLMVSKREEALASSGAGLTLWLFLSLAMKRWRITISEPPYLSLQNKDKDHNLIRLV